MLVFVESILNDAVSMVFYDTVSEFEGEEGTLFLTLFIPLLQFFFILIGSSLIGMLTGFLGSLILNDQTCPDSVDTKNYYFFAKIE